MCYNEFMVRSIHKINIAFIIALLIGAGVFMYLEPSVNAEEVPFNVDIKEALTVSISAPTTWANGSIDQFLRNKVTVTALTNNNSGVTVSMYAANKKLINTAPHTAGSSSFEIDTLGAETTAGSFTTNAWGYSLDDTLAGSSTATYMPMTLVDSPVTVLESTLGSKGTKDVYFGAKANTTKKSGTYAQTVYFVAVTGTLDPSLNPQVPTDPTQPSQPDATPIYYPTQGVSTGGQTGYTTRAYSGSGTSSVSGTSETTTTQVSKGDTTDSYVRAAGVTTTTPTTTTSSNVSTLGIALASAAAVSAASGAAFLIAAKRRKNDDEEE